MTEREVAKQARGMLYQAVMHRISQKLKTSNDPQGLKPKTKVISRYKDGQLVRIGVSGPKHLYVQNYGFEGVKSTGINMRLKPTDIVNDAIKDSGVIDFLATQLSAIRAEEILIQFRG